MPCCLHVATENTSTSRFDGRLSSSPMSRLLVCRKLILAQVFSASSCSGVLDGPQRQSLNAIPTSQINGRTGVFTKIRDLVWMLFGLKGQCSILWNALLCFLSLTVNMKLQISLAQGLETEKAQVWIYRKVTTSDSYRFLKFTNIAAGCFLSLC